MACAPGCGAPPHPPELGTEPANLPEARGSMFSGSGPVEPSCTVGVEGGVCVCTDQPLALDPPTLYFVLDRSGSMNDLLPGSQVESKWAAVQGVLANLARNLGPRAKYAVAVFPDPQQDACVAGREIFPPLQGDAPAGSTGNVELSIFSTLHQISAAGGTPTAATLNNLAPRIESLSGKTYVIFATDGGPNCDASATCPSSSCTYNMESAPDCPPLGVHDCCADPGGSVGCLDAQPSLDAVSALAAAGIPVYVLGVPGSEPYANLLDQLATAGGSARGSEPAYYAVTDQAGLDAALAQVAAKITGSCTLTLGSVPPDPARVNVFFDGQPVAQAGTDGWALDATTVILLGASCAKVLNGEVLDVRVVAGCPTVTY